MNFEVFKQRFTLYLDGPKTINSGTSKVMFEAIEIFLLDRSSGVKFSTQLFVQELISADDLLMEVYRKFA